MSNIQDVLKDVLKHTHGLGIFEMVKLRGDAGETEIETVDGAKTVIVKAKTHKPVAELEGHTVGLSRMKVLSGFINYDGFGNAKAVVDQRNGEDVLTELTFKSNEGTTAAYRFMTAEIINSQLQDIKFKGATFEVEIVPTEKNLKDLTYFNSTLSEFESTFSPKTEKDKLYFHIGDNGGDRTKLQIAEGVKGSMAHDHKWPLDIVLKILRLSDSANVTMGFNNRGLIQITVDSGIAEYKYLLPTKG